MSHETDATAVFDQDRALVCLDGDMGLFLEIIEMYLADGPSRLEEIREGLKKRDAQVLERAAHRLRGSLGALAASLAADAAETLESLAVQGDFSKIEGAVAALDREAGRLRLALEKFIKARA